MEELFGENGDIDEIERLLDDVGVECVTFEDETGRRRRCQHLLEAAILAGSVVAVKAIFKHPQISLYVSKDGRSRGGRRDSCPALVALRSDCSEILRVLVEQEGVDAFGYRSSDSTDEGRDSDRGCGVHGSVFVTACKDGRLNCIRYLLSRLLLRPSADDVIIPVTVTSCGGSDVRRRKVIYYGAVAAVENDRDDVLRELLEAGSMDVTVVMDNDIGTALHVAAQCNSVRCAKLLLPPSSPRDRHHHHLHHPWTMDNVVEATATDRQQTPLMKAAEHSSVEVMEMLLDAGADIDRQTHECSNALIISCHFGHMQCVELLLAHGANPHLKNRWGFTALYMGTDTPAILDRMLKEPVDVNEHCGDRQEVPLHLATVIGSVDAINSLLDRGAEVNRRTVYNENALWLAVWKDHTDAARVLIQNNIDLDAESNGWQVYIWYYHPIEVALGLCNYEVVRMLLVAGCRLRNRRYFRSESEAGPLADVGLPWVQLRSEAFDYLREDKFNFLWLKEMLTSAANLKNVCRRTIRRLLRIPIREKVKQLPIPIFLQDYLLMNDI